MTAALFNYSLVEHLFYLRFHFFSILGWNSSGWHSPVVGMWCSPTSVRPGQFLNSSRYFSTIGINTGFEQLGSITVPSSMKLGIIHSSPMSMPRHLSPRPASQN